jgi:L,D-peptidoglycan transpeptidase YkuD (ErfK/YbiS/YcfS/YnhG family)
MRVPACLITALLGSVTSLAWADHAVQTAATIDPSHTVVGSTSAGGSTATPNVVSGLSVSVPLPTADEVIVRKSERRMYLMRNGRVLRSYRVELGLDPVGPKQRSGDFKTPEGLYYLVRRNPRSDYFLSIQVSYPNAQDIARARRAHEDPGGAIMIHGLPNTLSHKISYYSKDWTDGCIALSDSDMVEIWLMTRDNTPIDILP